jgi:hypothetical protein
MTKRTCKSAQQRKQYHHFIFDIVLDIIHRKVEEQDPDQITGTCEDEFGLAQHLGDRAESGSRMIYAPNHSIRN